MLAQDSLTGALYEVPEYPLSGWGLGESPYEGYGFAGPGFGGIFDTILKGAKSLLGGGIPGLPPIPGLSNILGGGGLPGLPNLGNLLGPLRGILGGGGGAPGLPGIPGLPNLGNLLGPLRGILGGGGGVPGLPGIPGLPNLGNLLGPLRGLFGGGGGTPGPGRPPWPIIGPGGMAPHLVPLWMRPPLPYTGVGPRRMYMRCSTWPAVPPVVAHPLGPYGPAVPGAVPGAPVPVPGVPAPVPWGGGRRRHRGFRRRR